MSKHTPEPWAVDAYAASYIWGPKMEMIADLDDEHDYVVRMRGTGENLPQKENAERIVECVNACKGFQSDELKDQDLKSEMMQLMFSREKLRRDRVNLIEALKDLHFHCTTENGVDRDAFTKAIEQAGKVLAEVQR